MIKIEEILRAKTSKEIKNNIYKKLEKEISEIKAEYEYVFETEDELINFIKKVLDECINNYEKDYEEFELYFSNKIKEAIRTFLKIQLEKQHFKVVDNYINYLSKNKIDDNYKYIYLLSELTSFVAEEARFNLMLYLINNQDVLFVLDSIAKKDKIKVVDIPKIYRNDILLNILETYCNDKEKEFVDITIDDSDIKIDDSTRAYLNEIRKFEILPKEKQMELAYQASLGDEKAKQSLINSNLRLVVPIAKKYQNKGLDLLDLIQEGNIGLIKAIKLYDVSKGFAFSTYATWWIRQVVSRAVMDKGKTIRIPVYKYDKHRKFFQAKEKLTRELKREPSAIELAEELELSIEKVNELILSVCETTSLNAFIGDDEKSELINFIKDEQDLENDIMSSVNSEELLSLLKTTLTKKQFDIVCLRLGLTDGRKWLLEEIGQKYNLSRERIRQIEAKAYRKMRALRKTRDFMDKKESKNITTSKKDYTFEERAEIFLEEQNLSKYKDNKIKFQDNMSMCSWFNYNKDKIFESTIDACIKIKGQFDSIKNDSTQENKRLTKLKVDDEKESNKSTNGKPYISKHEKLWLETYEVAKKYYEKNKHLLVPFNYKTEYKGKIYNLGTWVHTQRKNYKLGKLLQERINLLNEISMIWDLKAYEEENIDEEWQFNYNLAKDYFNKYGHLLIPCRYEVNIDGKVYRLGTWIQDQRKAYNGYYGYRLSKKQIDLSNEIGMVWKIKSNGDNINNEYEVDENYNKCKGDIKMANNEQERLDEQKTGFYLEFPAYKAEDVNKAFDMLSEKQKEIILKKYDGSLTNQKNTKNGILEKKEQQLYWIAKNRIQQLIENGFKKRTPSKKETNEAKKDEVQKNKLNENNEEKNKNSNQTQIINELNENQVDETEKSETKENIDNKQVNQQLVKEISPDVNEAYLKLYELLSLPCFTNMMINKKYYDVMFIKMKFPNKSIKEISDFTGLSEKEIASFLLDGIDELTLKIEVMLKEMLAEYKQETSKTTGSYVKKDNM